MQNDSAIALQARSNDRGAGDLTEAPEREVVFTAPGMNSLVLWFSSFHHREMRDEDVRRLLDMPVPGIAILRNYKSDIQVLRSAKDGQSRSVSFNSACDSQIASGYGIPGCWHVAGTICQAYSSCDSLARSGFYYLERKVGHLFDASDFPSGLRPRTTAAMHLVNAINNGWLSRETLDMCGRPAQLDYHKLYHTDPVVLALENATKCVGMLTHGTTILETAQHVLTHGRNFADNLNETLSKACAQEAWA